MPAEPQTALVALAEASVHVAVTAHVLGIVFAPFDPLLLGLLVLERGAIAVGRKQPEPSPPSRRLPTAGDGSAEGPPPSGATPASMAEVVEAFGEILFVQVLGVKMASGGGLFQSTIRCNFDHLESWLVAD